MLFQIVVLADQHPTAAKTFEEIVVTARLMGLDAEYLRGDSRFVKIFGEDNQMNQLSDLLWWVRSFQYAPSQDGDTDDDI